VSERAREREEEKRLPFTPLLAWCSPDGNGSETARMLGVSASYINKLRHKGVSHNTADMLASRLGVHPWEIWGREWWE
jgi:hypothetical protein